MKVVLEMQIIFPPIMNVEYPAWLAHVVGEYLFFRLTSMVTAKKVMTGKPFIPENLLTLSA